MLQNFLKNLGLGVLAAVVGGVAGYFADPSHFAQLGVFSGAAALVAAQLAELLKKLKDKIIPPAV